MSQKRFRLGVGVPSAVFLVLAIALTALAVLGLSCGQGDLALTKRSVQMTESYYEAVQTSERTLAAVDKALSAGKTPEAAALENGGTLKNGVLHFRFDAGAGRELTLVVRMNDAAGGARYTIVSRALNTAPDGITDDYLPVYRGTEDQHGAD